MKKLLFTLFLFAATAATAQTSKLEPFHWRIYVYEGTPKPKPVNCCELIETPEGDFVAGYILIAPDGNYIHKSIMYCKEQVFRYTALR